MLQQRASSSAFFVVAKRMAILTLLIFCLSSNILLAQPDTLAHAKITNLAQSAAGQIEMDLLFKRTSDVWDRFANATFQFQLINFPSTNCSIELLPGTSQLPANYILEDSVTTSLLGSRMAVAVLGPKTYAECVRMEKDSNVRIGRFRISSLDGTALPARFEWLQPITRFQASAYKTPEPKPLTFNEDDNIEMKSMPSGTEVLYLVDTLVNPPMMLVFLRADYKGVKNVDVVWQTKSEYRNKGFVLRRGIRPFTELDNSNVKFDTVIARYTTNGALIGLGSSFTGKDYLKPDVAQYRAERYVYQLSYVDFSDVERELATADVYIPNSIISFSKAEPNPFTDKTTVTYVIDDRVSLSAFVYTTDGKVIGKIFENEIRDRGTYIFEFQAPDLSTKALNIVFMADPIQDKSVEKSQNVLKLQIIK